MLVVVDRFNNKDVLIHKTYESLYLKLRKHIEYELKFFSQFYTIKHDDVLIIDELDMIKQVLELMTVTDVMLDYNLETYESIHEYYISNLLLLYKITDNHDILLEVNVLKEVQRIYKKEVE